MARGSLLKRTKKSGGYTWDIKYRTGDGTQVKKAIGPSRKEAERALNAALAAVDRGAIRTSAREPFRDASARWLERKRSVIEASTYRGYEIEIRTRLDPFFGDLKLRQITRAHVERYLAMHDREGRLSRKTINDSLIPLRQILGRAVREGVISANPALNVDRDEPLELPYERPAMKYLARADARAYLAACPQWYRPLAEVLVGAGLRIGEAIALEWRDVSVEGLSLTIERAAKDSGIGTPKGDRARRVLVAPYLIELLLAHRSHQAAEGEIISPLVFTSPTGKRLDRHNVRRRGHDAALQGAGLNPSIRLHDLRHTAATLWLASGESIYFVQQQLGHKDIQTTIDLYGHPDQDAHREAAARAASWWREDVS